METLNSRSAQQHCSTTTGEDNTEQIRGLERCLPGKGVVDSGLSASIPWLFWTPNNSDDPDGGKNPPRPVSVALISSAAPHRHGCISFPPKRSVCATGILTTTCGYRHGARAAIEVARFGQNRSDRRGFLNEGATYLIPLEHCLFMLYDT